MTEQNEASDSKPCGCKLGRISDRYDLIGLDTDLDASWTGEGDERSSTRELAARVNRRVLRAALKDADVSFKMAKSRTRIGS